MSKQQEFIQSLSADLKPVKPAMSADLMAIIWLGLTALYIIAASHYFGPIRPGALGQLQTVPRFLLENLAGLGGFGCVIVAGFRSAIPGLRSQRLLWFGAVLIGLWLTEIIAGLWRPALPPSMMGKREGCWIQTMVFSVPPMVVALVLTRRLYPLKPFKTTALCCLVAGMLPALYMQLACMYIVPHMLMFHILPGIGMALLGTFLGVVYYKLRP